MINKLLFVLACPPKFVLCINYPVIAYISHKQIGNFAKIVHGSLDPPSTVHILSCSASVFNVRILYIVFMK